MTHFGRVMEALTDRPESWWNSREGERMIFSGRDITFSKLTLRDSFARFEVVGDDAFEILETRELIPRSDNRAFVCRCNNGTYIYKDGKELTCRMCKGKILSSRPSTLGELITFAMQDAATIALAETLLGEYVGDPSVLKIWKFSGFTDKSNAGKYSPLQLAILKELGKLGMKLRFHPQFSPALTIPKKF